MTYYNGYEEFDKPRCFAGFFRATRVRVGPVFLAKGHDCGSGFRATTITGDGEHCRDLAKLAKAKVVKCSITHYPGVKWEFEGSGRQFIRWAIRHWGVVSDSGYTATLCTEWHERLAFVEKMREKGSISMSIEFLTKDRLAARLENRRSR
jgi:hypothetical protein